MVEAQRRRIADLFDTIAAEETFPYSSFAEINEIVDGEVLDRTLSEAWNLASELSVNAEHLRSFDRQSQGWNKEFLNDSKGRIKLLARAIRANISNFTSMNDLKRQL